MSILGLTEIAIAQNDKSTDTQKTLSHVQQGIHCGDNYFILYSVVDLGAMAAPDDTITLTFTTPNTVNWGHFVFRVIGSPDWRVRLIEAPTGGGASPTGALEIFNSNRNSDNKSSFKDLSGVVNQVSYDATLATGGKTLWDEYWRNYFRI